MSDFRTDETEIMMINKAGALIGLGNFGANTYGMSRNLSETLKAYYYMNLTSTLERHNWNCSLECTHLSLRDKGWHLPDGFVRGVAINGKPFREALEEYNLEIRGNYLTIPCCGCETCVKNICLVFVTDRKLLETMDENLKMSIIYKTASDCAVAAGKSAGEAARLMNLSVISVNNAANYNQRSQKRKKAIRGDDCMYDNILIFGSGCGC